MNGRLSKNYNRSVQFNLLHLHTSSDFSQQALGEEGPQENISEKKEKLVKPSNKMQ